MSRMHAVGPLVRRWRTARGLSQASLAERAEISTRHLSFVETGKSSPSREMVLVLAGALDLPLRERNAMLLAAGFAPVYGDSESGAPDEAELSRVVALVLGQQEPFPAVAFDRGWNLVRANVGAARLLAWVFAGAPPPVEVASNVLRLLLHPAGLRPLLVNWDEVVIDVLERLRRDAASEPGDGPATALLREADRYGSIASRVRAGPPVPPRLLIPVHLRKGGIDVRLFTTITTLGTPLDVAAQELRIESYFPMDEATERFLREELGRDAAARP